jgi:hypothetical protein
MPKMYLNKLPSLSKDMKATNFVLLKYGIYILTILLIGLTKSTEGLTIYEIIFLIIFLLLTGNWFLIILKTKKLYLPIPFIKLPIFLLIFIYILSFIMALYNNVKFIDWFENARVYLIFILFFIIINGFQTRKELKNYIFCFVLVATLITVKDIYNYFVEGGLNYIGEFAGIEYASILFILAVPFLYTFFIFNENILLRLLTIIILFLISFRVFISMMRSYVFATFIITSVYFILSIKMKIKKYLFSLIILMLIFSMMISIILFLPETINLRENFVRRIEVLSDFYGKENYSAYTRFVETEAAWNIALKQPLIGHGFGYKFQYYRPNGIAYEIPYVHLTPLYFILTIGFIGLFLIVWIIFEILKLNLHILKKEKNLFWRLIIASIFSNFIGYIFLSLFDTNVLRIDSLFYFTVAVGIITKIYILQEKEER